MELSDPATPDTSIDMSSTVNRRKSGRATQKPVLLNKDPNISQISTGNSGKRKRADPPTYDVMDSNDTESEDETSDDESDPDEEELKERRRKAPRPKKAPSKSVAKKPRTGPALTTNLAVRPAVNGAKKAARPKQPRARPVKKAEENGTGLYCQWTDPARLRASANNVIAEVFSEGHTLEAVAADWIARWGHNNVEAMCDMINFVIKCTGCNSQVNVHDIEDQDNAPSKLGDIQEDYQALKPTDYPLISKAKGIASFRSTLSGFFATLISSCHAAGLLYSDEAILENIEIWVHTMSSSSLRPFRHTATLIALTIGNTLCTVAADIAENAAKTMRQKEGEQKKKSVNKERVKALEAKIAEGDRRRTQVLESMKYLFDAVFIHRYRDVDPKIRLECVTALGSWITTLPDVYFDGMHLRYLGWVLSDISTPTRAEVVKQLGKLFKNKDNAPRLRTFTEKFRARIVEMAVKDSEVSIRAATVELLDMIRKMGLLEPDDIDVVGRLIFDTEPRVRKAVAGFFAENINDLYETTLEDFGGEEGLADILGEEVEDDFDTPRSSWLKLKCIAEALQSYDAEDDEQDSALRDARGAERLIATGVDSRYAMAARTICDGVSVAREWEVLAGYLLFDFSSTDQPSEDADVTLESRCKLNEKETILLLEVLNVAVKARLSDAVEAETDKRGHKTKALKEESRAIQESTAIHLAKILPQLLKKSGSNPSTASGVLRLGQVLDLEIFQELRQDSTTYASLLDDINKQFLTHTDQSVLAEASTALLHARGFEDLEEVTESKVQGLWEDTISTLRVLMSSRDNDNISELCNTVRRIANLASISDCVAVLDLEGRSASKKKATPQTTASPLSLLMELIHDPELDDGAGEEADETLISATKAILFYYMWTVRSLQIAISSGTAMPNFPDFALFAQSLGTLVDNRLAASPVRLAAVSTFLDLYTLFATFRHLQLPPDHHNADDIQSLIQHIPTSAESLILSTYTALEKIFAKKSHRTLEAAPDDDLASDPEDSSDDDEDEDEPRHAQQETLIAEKRLCEIAGKMVLAIVGRVLDHEGPKKGKIKERLQRNKARLGSNFKEVLAYLDGPKPKGKKRAPAKKGGKRVVRPVVIEDEDEESEDERQLEEGGEEDLRERELVEDRIVDPDEESAGEGETAGAGADEGGDDDDDDVMGD